MEFTGVCLITDDVPKMRRFYTRVLCVDAEGDDRHVELRTEGVGVAIFSVRGMEEMAPLSTRGIGHGGVTIGFKVRDVDKVTSTQVCDMVSWPLLENSPSARILLSAFLI